MCYRRCDIYFLVAASGLRAFCKMPPNTLFCCLFTRPSGGFWGAKKTGFDPQARNKTEMGIQSWIPFICCHYHLRVLRPFVLFSFLGGLVVLFLFSDMCKICKQIGALVALFSVMSCFGRFRSTWGLRGPTSLNTSSFSVFCVFFFCFFLCWSIWGDMGSRGPT